MERKLHIASWIIIGILLLPMFQQVTDLFYEKKLKGSHKTADYPDFTTASWLNTDFQQKMEPALKDRFGFRGFFIRVNNQIAYSLYKKANAKWVLIGKEKYLYESNYIKARQGEDFLGDSLIAERFLKIRAIHDTLEARGKQMFIAFAAGKGSFYPEYFPDELKKESGRTNLASMKEHCEAYGIDYIDFNQWFLAMKDTSSYCLYPRTGVHWSYYGMHLVIDSMRNYISDLSASELPSISWDGVKESKKYKSSDSDIEDGLNILFRINRDKLAYPVGLNFDDHDKDTLSAIIVSDSFYWGLHNIGFSHRIMHESEFWYYNEQIYSIKYAEALSVDDIDASAHLDTADVIILLGTEATLTRFPYGFEDTILK